MVECENVRIRKALTESETEQALLTESVQMELNAVIIVPKFIITSI